MRRLIAFFAALTMLILSLRFDGALSLWVATNRSVALEPFARILNNLWPIYVFISILSIYLIKRRRFDILAVLLLSVTAAPLASDILKVAVGRPRPFLLLPITSLEDISSFSFPSGHLTLISSLLGPLKKIEDDGLFGRLPVLAIYPIYMVLVAYFRLFAGIHFLSDLMGGAILGCSTGWLFLRLNEKGLFEGDMIGYPHFIALTLLGIRLVIKAFA
ncbi:MAG: phosphatase PAP2 family protein [Actinomycetota bacterium]|nr:phosphatase PAP2 family protein [Actinomycetota bacterium]